MNLVKIHFFAASIRYFTSKYVCMCVYSLAYVCMCTFACVCVYLLSMSMHSICVTAYVCIRVYSLSVVYTRSGIRFYVWMCECCIITACIEVHIVSNLGKCCHDVPCLLYNTSFPSLLQHQTLKQIYREI